MIRERRLLQFVVAIAALIPISAGAVGVLFGPAMVGIAAAPIGADSHYRYLSGLLLGIGIGFAATVPRIETNAIQFRLLAALVVIGGLGRLVSLVMRGYPDAPMLFGLAMELGVTPALACWQGRVAAQAVSSPL